MKQVLVVKQQKEISYKSYTSVMDVTKKEAALIKKHQKNKPMTNVERGRYHKLMDRLNEEFFESNYTEDPETDWDEGLIEEIVSVDVIKGKGNSLTPEQSKGKQSKEEKKSQKKREEEIQQQEQLSADLEQVERQQSAASDIDDGLADEPVSELGT